MTPQFILATAFGGAIGSVARYLVGIGRADFRYRFPLGHAHHQRHGIIPDRRFIGLLATRWDASPALRIFLTVGICGGYTTFSTFSLDAFYLIERGQSWLSAAYMVSSVLLSVGALMAALRLVRAFT